MSALEDNVLDVESSPKTILSIEEIWAQTWSKNFGIFAAIAVFCNTCHEIYYGGLLLEPVNFPLILGTVIGLLIFSFVGGLILGLVLAFIPLRNLSYLTKLPLTIAFGAFLINAKFIFSILAGT